MKLLVYILNRIELLDDILLALSRAGIGGATILNSRGMARQLYGNAGAEQGFLSSLRALADPQRDDNVTILAALREDQVPDFVRAIEDIGGDLSTPGTGILFTMPIDFIKGLQ